MLQSLQQEEAWEPPQQQEETLETSQDSWQQVQQQEIPEPTQEQEAMEPTENQTGNNIKSKVDYGSYLVIKEQFKDFPVTKEYRRLKENKDEIRTIDDIKLQVYNDLYEFFSRYYEDGDFVPRYRFTALTQIFTSQKLLLCWTLGDIGIQPIRNGGVI